MRVLKCEIKRITFKRSLKTCPINMTIKNFHGPLRYFGALHGTSQSISPPSVPNNKSRTKKLEVDKGKGS